MYYTDAPSQMSGYGFWPFDQIKSYFWDEPIEAEIMERSQPAVAAAKETLTTHLESGGRELQSQMAAGGAQLKRELAEGGAQLKYEMAEGERKLKQTVGDTIVLGGAAMIGLWLYLRK